MELLKETFPKISRVAVVLNPEGQVPSQGYEQLKSLAQSLKVNIESFNVRNPNDIDKAFEAIAKRRADGLLLESDPVFNTNRANVINLWRKQASSNISRTEVG